MQIKTLCVFLFIVPFIISKESLVRMNGLIPEDSFIPLESHIIKKFEITPEQKEIYFSFDNEYEGSDLIINLQIGNCYTVYAYFYDSYEKIKVNDDGDYIDYVGDMVLNGKLLILKNSDARIKKTKYYIILKDIFGGYNKDYISIYNEQDIITFKTEEPFIIDMFFSKNKYSLTFEQESDEVITIELNTNNEELTQYISISLNNEIIYRGEKNKGFIKLNEKKNLGGTYFIEIYSLEDSYISLKNTFILHKQKTNVFEITPENYLSLSYGNTKIFNFYVDIDDYDLDEEGIVTFKFGNQIYGKKLLEHCYAKSMNFLTINDNKFLANMPALEEENEAVMERLGTSDTIYHLYFKKTKRSEESERTFLLIHLSIKVEDDNFFLPEKFYVYLSPRSEMIFLGNKNNSGNIINRKIKLNNYIPQLFRIIILDDNEQSFIIYTSEKVQTFYNNSMMNSEHSFENSRKIYAISHENKNINNLLYLKLYGNEGEIQFRIESTYSSIYYLKENKRPVKTFNQMHTNCGHGFYYIGDYEVVTNKGHFFFENLIGKYNIFYKNKINKEDKNILIDENEKYLIKDNIGTLNTTLDIIEIQCVSPGYFNFHLINDTQNSNINMYSRIVEFLTPEKSHKITPTINPLTENIKIEISKPLGKIIKVNDGKQEITIDSNKKYYRINYNNFDELPPYFELSSTKETIFSFIMTNEEEFKIIKEDYIHLEGESEIVIKLKKDNNYKKVSIKINRIYHGFSSSLSKNTYGFDTKLSESGYDFITPENHQIDISLSNPYDYQIDDEDTEYYISLSIVDPEVIQKDVNITYEPLEKYENIILGETKIINNDDEKYSINKINKNIKLIYQSCGNSLKEVNMYHNDDVLNIFSNKNITKYQFEKIQSHSLNQQVGIDIYKHTEEIYKGAVVGFTSSDISQSEIDKYNKMSLNVTQNGKKIKWDKIENIQNYEIYVLNKDNENIKYLYNPCYLNYIKKNNSIINDNITYIKYYSTKENYYYLKEEGLYKVIVSGSVKGNIPLVFIYNELDYDSSSPPYDEDDGNTSFYFLVIGVPIILIIVLVLIFSLIRKKENSQNEQRISLSSPINRPTFTSNDNRN